jgi:1-pyrroline-5-carboxylate dehydrogenase
MIGVPYIFRGMQQCITSTTGSRAKAQWINCRYSDVLTISRNSRLSQAQTVQEQHQRSYSASLRRSINGVPSWATYDPKLLGTTETPYAVQNIVNGVWQHQPSNSNTKGDNSDDSTILIPHPYNTDIPYPIFTVPNTTNIQPFVDSLRSCPKTGLHNPYKNVERYVQYGDISRKVNLIYLI